MPMKQRVVDHIVGHLAAIGVDYIFGVDGANIEDLYDAAFFQSDITAVLAKHEFSAATMADGYSRSGAGGTYQAADVLYYASGGYYVALTLHQLWPVTVEGQASTLVWRGDMISSTELGSLHGVERLGSESVMMKNITKAVTAFRRESGGR